MPLAVFIRAEKYNRARKRAQEGGRNAGVETPTKTFLPQDLSVGVTEGGVARGEVRGPLLPRLYRVDTVHEHVPAGTTEAAREHAVSVGVADVFLLFLFQERWGRCGVLMFGGGGGVSRLERGLGVVWTFVIVAVVVVAWRAEMGR